jgi:hypothetical protein
MGASSFFSMGASAKEKTRYYKINEDEDEEDEERVGV